MDAFLTSAALVAIAELGDKTQLLAILLAAQFRQPVPIILGILAATLLNHAAAASLGYLLANILTGSWFRIAMGAGFIAMAGWALIPDKPNEGDAGKRGGGVFMVTLISFFLVEIGDKTQVATSLLAARFHDILLVTAGTTTGMMIADAPAVLFGEAVTRWLPLRVIRLVAAGIFAGLGVFVVIDALRGL